MPYGVANKNPPNEFSRSIIRLASALRQQLGASLTDPDMTLTEFWALACLRDGEAWQPSTLADALGIDRGQATRVIKIMAGKGWVRRSRDSGDLRTLHLELTDRGRNAVALAEPAVRSRERELLSELSEPEARKLIATISGILEMS